MTQTGAIVQHTASSPPTDNTLFGGRLVCRQPGKGYRFSVDAVLAAHFTAPRPGSRVLDLGCGCGVIGLILAYRRTDVNVVGLERQPELAALSAENSLRNNLGERCTVRQGDVCAIEAAVQPESFDLVVCNPPYQKLGGGRVNPDNQSALARHELGGTIDDFVRAAAFAVKNRGQVVFVYPARRAIALLTACVRYRLTPKRLQPVYSWPEAASARLILVEARKNGGEEVELLIPWFIYQRRHGAYTQAMRNLYEE